MHNYHDTWKQFPLPGMIANELAWTVSILPQIEQQGIADRMNYNAGTINSCYQDGIWGQPHRDLPLPQRQRDRHQDEVRGRRVASRIRTARLDSSLLRHLGSPRHERRDGPTYRCVNLAEAFGGECQQGVMWQYASNLRDILDGTSNTYLLGEMSWKDMPYYRAWIRGKFGDTRGTLYLLAKNLQYPLNSKDTTLWNGVAFGSMHPGGAMFTMSDASTRFVADSINFDVYLASGSKDGNESSGGQQSPACRGCK